MQSTSEALPEDARDPSGRGGVSSARYNGEYIAVATDLPRADDADLELGSARPLLADFPPDNESESDSDFGFDIPRHNSRRDPSLTCSRDGLVAWCKGPDPPHIHRVTPWFPKWQTAPARLVERLLPGTRMKIAALLGGLLFWFVIFFSSLKSSVAGQEVPGYGQPVKLSCHARLWYVLSAPSFMVALLWLRVS